MVSIQVLKYNPSGLKYPGNAEKRASTQQSQCQQPVSQELTIWQQRAGQPSYSNAGVAIPVAVVAAPSNKVIQQGHIAAT
jgi:hypothetical protein